MADQEASGKFVPFLKGNFQTGGHIVSGAQTSTPYRKGVQDLAQNNNTIWARTRKMLFCDAKSSSNTINAVATIKFTFAYYKIPIPTYVPPSGTTGRRMVSVFVLANAAAGNWTITATTPSGTATSSSYSGTQLATVDVPCGINDIEQIQIEMTCASTTTATISLAYGYLKIETTTDINSVNDPYQEDIFIPLDQTLYSPDYPLSVWGAQAIGYNNESLFRESIRNVVSYCTWDAFDALDTYVGTTRRLFVTNQTDELQVRAEWVYFPRQGVDKLKVMVNGFVASWASGADDAQFRIGIKDTDSYADFSIDTNHTAFLTTWTEENIELTLPNQPGPIFIYLSGTDAGKRAYINAICIMEGAI